MSQEPPVKRGGVIVWLFHAIFFGLGKLRATLDTPSHHACLVDQFFSLSLFQPELALETKVEAVLYAETKCADLGACRREGTRHLAPKRVRTF